MKYLLGLDKETGAWEVYSAHPAPYGSYSAVHLIRSFGLFDQAMRFICERENGHKAANETAPETAIPEAAERSN